jgi:hypothetical protein
MAWMAVDIDMDDDPKIERVDGFARSVLQYIWRKAKLNDIKRGNRAVDGVSKEDGFIKIDMWDAGYLTRKTGFPNDCENHIKIAMQQLAKQLVVVGKEYVSIPNWRKYQRKVQATRRVQEHRAAKLEPVDDVKRDETQCDAMLRDVTQCNATEQGVTQRNSPLTMTKTTTTTKTNTTSSKVSTSPDVNTSNCSNLEESGKQVPASQTFENSVHKKDAYKLADFMVSEIRKFKPDYKAIQPSKLEKTKGKWAIVFERMLRLDKLTPRAIAELMRWAYKEPFWQPNILTAEKFRHQYERLEIVMKNAKAENKTKPDYKMTSQDKLNDLGIRIGKGNINNQSQRFDLVKIQRLVSMAKEDKLLMPLELSDFIKRGGESGLWK